MGWGSRVHRPASSGAFGGKTGRYRPRIVISSHVITISQAMTEPVIVTPDFSCNLIYATDLYQRIYPAPDTPYQIRKTLQLNGALYSAAAVAGVPPGPEDTWTIVASSELGSADGDTVRHVFQTPTWFTGLEYVALWTSVYQPSGAWVGAFSVIHELWGNFFRWNRVTNPTILGMKSEETRTQIRDTSIRLLGRSKG